MIPTLNQGTTDVDMFMSWPQFFFKNFPRTVAGEFINPMDLAGTFEACQLIVEEMEEVIRFHALSVFQADKDRPTLI